MTQGANYVQSVLYIVDIESHNPKVPFLLGLSQNMKEIERHLQRHLDLQACSRKTRFFYWKPRFTEKNPVFPWEKPGKPGFSGKNLVFLVKNLVCLKNLDFLLLSRVFRHKPCFSVTVWKPRFSTENPGFLQKTQDFNRKPRFSGRKTLHAELYPFGLP